MDKTLRQIIRESIREQDLSVRDRVKLRMIMRWKPDVLERELFNHVQAEGLVAASVSIDDVAAVDWKAIAEFIKEILPAVLQIIQLFL